VAVLVPVLLYLLIFLLMPFSVFGVKGRLEGLEARLDEIQSEIRLLTLRLPETGRGRYDDMPIHPEPGAPPIPPAAGRRAPIAVVEADDPPPRRRAEPRRMVDEPPDEPDDSRRRRPAPRPERTEPRLGWPR
jgi:hypothetical protein